MKSYNNILENTLLPIGDKMLGTNYISRLQYWRRMQGLGERELEGHQRQKLNILLTHALEEIPFYKRQIKKGSTIMDFPIMSKAIIRENMNDLLWHPTKRNSLISEKSSGSSGVQGEIFMGLKERSNAQAIQTLFWEWTGYKIGSSLLQTGITPYRGMLKSIKDILFRTTYESAFGLDEEKILTRLKHIQTHPIDFFGGYASSLYVFAQVAEKYGIDNVKFRSVISWGDKLFEHYRSLIEKQFKTKVYDTYGTTEGFMIAAQKDLDYHYIISPHVYLEIVDDNGNEVPEGEIGYVVVTSLDAFEMPLIRYYLGDMAIKLPRHLYPQKRELNFPLLQKIVGRDTDIVRTTSGKSMIVHFFTGIFEHIPEIRQFKVIQDQLDAITVQYIPGDNFKEGVLEQIRSKIENRLGEQILIEFNKVDYIGASASGKPQIVVSRLANQKKIW